MEKHFTRKRYFIHTSSQLKYICMTMLPALFMGAFCTYFLMKSGEVLLAREKTQIRSEISFIDETISVIGRENYPPDTILKVEVLKKRLSNVGQNLEIEYLKTMGKWAETKMTVVFLICVILAFSGVLSVLYSHRIAGPLMRMRRCIDMLAEGKDIPPFHFRNYDEFKEVGASFDRLRQILKDKGLLKS
jgi:hypothetical protein